MKPMFAYVPENLDLRSEVHRDKYYFIITYIFYGRIFYRKKSISFIQLYSQFLKKVINGKYKNYITKLLNWGIIETDNHYRKKIKSKGYRLTEKYRDAKTVQVRIEDEKLIANYWNYKVGEKKKISEFPHQYISSCLEKVEIEYDAAKEYLNKSDLDFEQYSFWNCSVDMIHSKDWFFRVDSTAGRVHNNITNLPSAFRPFLRFNNEKLVEIDISNSQPLLFNVLISRYIWRYTSHGGTSFPYVPPSTEIYKYKKLTEEGKFYEYVMDELGIQEERSKFKIRLFSKVFFSKEEENEERKIFRRLFPDVSEIISYYKRVNYRYLAIELQKVEAEIMIHSVVPRLAEKKLFLLTIHDSILTTPDNVQVVKAVILDEFNKYNLRPTIKEKG